MEEEEGPKPSAEVVKTVLSLLPSSLSLYHLHVPDSYTDVSIVHESHFLRNQIRTSEASRCKN